jgi:hypothetical protein
MVDYLNSSEVMKTHDKEARNHAKRVMQTLIHHANFSPSTAREEIDNNHSKKIGFNPFPPKHSALHLSGPVGATKLLPLWTLFS